MKVKLFLIAIASMVIFAQSAHAHLGHTIIDCKDSLKSAAIFTAATTATMTLFNTGAAYLGNKYIYSRLDANAKSERITKGFTYGAGLGLLLSVCTLGILSGRSIAPERKEFAAKFFPIFLPIMSGLMYTYVNLDDINNYGAPTGSKMPDWLPYATVFTIGTLGSLAGFCITHLIAGK